MQRIEHKSEHLIYTKGDRALNYLFSLLSWLWVIIILTVSWVKRISETGYWAEPVKDLKPPIKVDSTKAHAA